MCGRLNVVDDPAVVELCENLGIKLWPEDEPEPIQQEFIFSRFIGAANDVSVIREVNGQRLIQTAKWWLLLEPTDIGFKPSKYTSFNTRWDKLNQPRSAGFKAFRESRCIIPAKGFGETELKQGKKHFVDFTAMEGEALAMGGLCREWVHHQTGEVALSCSIITLPPADWLLPYHSKASPLILPQHDNTLDMWLDSELKNVEVFDDLLKPGLHQDLLAQPIDKPSTHILTGDPVLIKATG